MELNAARPAPALKDHDLVTERDELSFQVGATPTEVLDCGAQDDQNADHALNLAQSHPQEKRRSIQHVRNLEEAQLFNRLRRSNAHRQTHPDRTRHSPRHELAVKRTRCRGTHVASSELANVSPETCPPIDIHVHLHPHGREQFKRLRRDAFRRSRMMSSTVSKASLYSLASMNSWTALIFSGRNTASSDFRSL